MSATLLNAVENNDYFAVKLLLENGVNPNYRQKETGRTPLMVASSEISDLHGKVMVKLLLAHGASLTEQNDKGRTALMLAAETQHKDIMTCLIEAGAKY